MSWLSVKYSNKRKVTREKGRKKRRDIEGWKRRRQREKENKIEMNKEITKCKENSVENRIEKQ